MNKFSKIFEVTKTGTPDEMTMSLAGPIIETSMFPIQDTEGVTHLILDLKDVSLINSGGIRLWLQWMTGIKSMNPRLIFTVTNVPKIMVDQMNYFKDFVPSPFIVQSVFVPYFCEECNVAQDQLMIRNLHFSEMADTPDLAKLPELECPNCHKGMEMDIFPEQYFKFLRNVRAGLNK